MFRKSHRLPGDLPQRPETWHVAIQQLRIWITPPDEEPSRPFVVLVLNLDKDMLQKLELVPDHPTPEQVLKILLQAMKEPPKELRQRPYRPTQIQFEDATLIKALTPELENLGIGAQQCPRPEVVDELFHDLELHMLGGPEHPGLLSVKGVTPELVGGLFAAAAEFYRAAPWVHLTDQQTLALRVSPEREERFVQVMGGGGIEYGLAMYRRWEDVERMYTFVDDPLETLPATGGHSLLFGEINLLPFTDLEAMEQYGWEVADKRAYPVPFVYTREGEVERPSRADLLWYEAALRAIPIFVRDHLRSDEYDDYLPVEVTLSVPTHAGETDVHIKYPAGTLPKETLPVHMAEWPEFEEMEEEEEGRRRRRSFQHLTAGPWRG